MEMLPRNNQTRESARRIPVWDQLRGVAIVAMVFTHFFFFDAAAFYGLSPRQLIRAAPLGTMIAGTCNLLASYLAPFLFLFIVGIISHIKTGRAMPWQRLAKRLLRLFIAALVLNGILIFLQHGKSLFAMNILVLILVVYGLNEIILRQAGYFTWRIGPKLTFLFAGTILIAIYNRYMTVTSYRDLPVWATIFAAWYMAILGDLFIDFLERGKSGFRLGVVAAGIMIVTAVFVPITDIHQVKRMHISYFFFCLAGTAWIYAFLERMALWDIARRWLLEPLEIMGRHSLTLFLLHFAIGYELEHAVRLFFPGMIHMVFLLVLLVCYGTAVVLERYEIAVI